jgi:hypothetical protein
MVLADLGSKVAIALRKMTQAPIVDTNVLNEMLAEICKAPAPPTASLAAAGHHRRPRHRRRRPHRFRRRRRHRHRRCCRRT